MRPFHLAILECDSPLSRTHAKYGGYGDVFTALLRSGAEALGDPDLVVGSDSNVNSNSDPNGTSNSTLNPKSEERNGADEKEHWRRLQITKWNVEKDMQRYPALDDTDGILVTGSRHSAFDSSPWILALVDFVRQALAHPSVRVIGVCFGHQIVGRAMGAKVARSDAGWEISVCEVELSNAGKELFEGRETLSLQQMHRDVVHAYPAGVRQLGASPRCSVQGMYVPHEVLTVQGHPEFDAEIVRELLEVRHEQGIFDDRVYEEALGRVERRQDSVVVARAFLRFLLEG